MSETDIAKPVIAYLLAQHWDVYQEVQFSQGGGVADIVGVRDGLMWIVECKTTLTLAVLEQASRWKSHFRSIAVPATLNRNSRGVAYRICQYPLEIGVMEIDKGQYVNVRVCAPLLRHNHDWVKRMYLPRLQEEHKTYSEAGTNSGSRWTPYQSTIKSVRVFLRENPGSTLKEIMDEVGKGHYSSTQSARSSLKIALLEYEKSWCECQQEGSVMRFFDKERM